MAKHHGNAGTIKFATLTIGELDSFSFAETAEVATGRAMGQGYQSARATGGKSWSGSLTCYLDEGDAGQAALLAGAEGAAQFYTDGETAGKTEYSGNIVIGSVDISPPKDGFVMMSATFTGDGALTGTVIA